MAAADLTSRFAHDINNHLTTILGKSELALLSDDPARMTKALEVGAEAARKSRELVAQMQRFAASQRVSELSTFDPLDAVRPVVVLLDRALDKHGVTLDRRFGQTRTMTGDLAPNHAADGVFDVPIRGAPAQDVSERGRVVSRQARAQLSVGLQAESVAGVAEVLAHR